MKATKSLVEAVEQGYLVFHTDSRYSGLLSKYVNYCLESNIPCVYGRLKSTYATVVVDLSTTNLHFTNESAREAMEILLEHNDHKSFGYLVPSELSQYMYVKRVPIEKLEQVLTSVTATIRREGSLVASD